jgi:tetratricopeptide (TPR) repeat protein
MGMPPRYSSTGMPENRLDILKTLVAQSPGDSFARYGLAMAYASAGNYEQAVEEYRKLIDINPKYVAAYYHTGQALEKLSRTGEARDIYRRGIAISTETGDQHARSELEAVLDLLG